MMSSGCSASCPFSVSRQPDVVFPVGQLRRLAPATGGDAADVDETKRNVLKLGAIAAVIAAAGGGLVGGALQYAQPPIVGLTSFPRVQLLDLDGSPLTATKVLNEYNVTTADVLTFNYPLTNTPNFLINVAPPTGGTGGATNVPGGTGPLGSIVGFSAICQHLGCPAPAIHFYPPGMCPNVVGGHAFYIHCTCHGSTYDVTNSASNLTGPAVLPLPQVTFDWNDPKTGGDDTLYAINLTGPPVNGHLSSLTGGFGVGSTSELTKQSPVLLCNF
jgi:Rieske Fe-S protein